MPDLRVERLAVEIRHPHRVQPVLKDVSLEVPSGRAVGLVGESGAGKSMTAYAIMRLLPVENAVITGGRVLFDDVDLLQLPEEDMQRYRGARIAIIFQEPSSALNPIMSVGEQVMEGVEAHFGRRGAKERALEALRQVGLDASMFRRYPHQLSGGQRQRVLIAGAIAPKPGVLIADEPTSGLDVTVQAQILDLLYAIQREMGMSLLLITHSLGLVAQRTDSVYVMRRGEIVESGPTMDVFRFPKHPYTQTLLRMAPTL
ncbi:MAG: ABC transporter ATP-binding protein [Armatimonadota bacterium]|nr:ABC transporter ATP-binding protein [Armatimonadota bacterium]